MFTGYFQPHPLLLLHGESDPTKLNHPVHGKYCLDNTMLLHDLQIPVSSYLPKNICW